MSNLEFFVLGVDHATFGKYVQDDFKENSYLFRRRYRASVIPTF